MFKQRKRMINGQNYRAADPELVYARARASRICTRYNRKPFNEIHMRARLMRKLLHTQGNFWIRPPFYCDYGFNITLGKNVLLNMGCVILDVCPVTIGEHTLIGPGTHIYTACHAIDPVERLHDVEYGKPVSIGKNVWIGGQCVILPGVTIGEGSVIGAGSVVTHDIPAGVVAFGNPARVIRRIGHKEKTPD